MKDTGIVRRIDVLGRVVIPKEIRKILKLSEGDPVEIYTDKDTIILKKYSHLTPVGDSMYSAAAALSKTTGHSAFAFDKERCIAASGAGSKEALSGKISEDILKLMKENKTLVVNHSEGGSPVGIVGNDSMNFANQLVLPIYSGEEAVGAIVLADRTKDRPITSSDINLTMLAAEFISALI